MSSFSIIICTYNPNREIFERLLIAVSKFDESSVHEVIIVDNNSNPPLYQNKAVQDFLARRKNSSIIAEKKPGLTSARMTGIKNAQYDWVIFFDDDNEPAPDYLCAAGEVINQHPQVGAWGPGILQVNYYQKNETKFLKKIKWLFQQRDYDATHFDNNKIEGSKYYPYGTGMIVKKAILDNYCERVEKGVYTMSDRKGKSLSSAGDLQILYNCILSGYYAGSSDKIRLNHLINGQKATHFYACRLIYALNSCQLKAYNEVFPDKIFGILQPGNFQIIKAFISAVRAHGLYKKEFSFFMFLSKKMGELNARIVASENKRKPVLLSLYEKILNV